MRILCRVENEEMQAWSMALSRAGHQFSFYDGQTAMHHVCHLFKPEMYICNNKYLNRSMQNACAKYKTVIINIDKHRDKLPLCANTIMYDKYPAAEHDGTLLVFGDPTEQNVGLVNRLSRVIHTKIFNQAKWPLNEYCGFINQNEFLNLVNKSFASLVLGDKLTARHLNVCASGGLLLRTFDADLGEKVESREDMIKLMSDPLLKYQRIQDYDEVRIKRSINSIIEPLMEVYEEENFFFD